MIPNSVKDIFRDIEDNNLPKNINNYDKIKGELYSGKRFYWYYKDDLDYFNDEGENIKDYLNDIFSGIIVPIPDTENNHGEIDVENVVVVIDQYPTEGCYPEVDWTTLKRLLDDDNLIEFFEKTNKNDIL